MSTIKKLNKKIRVLIVEDSPTESLYLQYLLESDEEIEVVGNVRNGKLAIEMVHQKKPDIVTMDIDMPILNGLEATRTIMSTCPVPILVVTASRNASRHDISMDALAAGALNVVQKPKTQKGEFIGEEGRNLITMVKVYSEVKVVRRRIPVVHGKAESIATQSDADKINSPQITRRIQKREYVVIGISSGGPDVLKRILGSLTGEFPLAIIVVQHITEGFLPGMVRWLDNLSEISIKIAEHNETIVPGQVYFAPSGHQLGITSNRISLEDKQTEAYKIRPSVSYTFGQFAHKYAHKTIAMLLTGMGTDGAQELKLLKDSGALTIAQDKDSSLVHGMAGAAINLDAATYIFNPEQISFVLRNIENQYQK